MAGGGRSQQKGETLSAFNRITEWVAKSPSRYFITRPSTMAVGGVDFLLGDGSQAIVFTFSLVMVEDGALDLCEQLLEEAAALFAAGEFPFGSDLVL